MNIKCRLGIHKWGKWEKVIKNVTTYFRKGLLGELDIANGVSGQEEYQITECVDCGKIKERKLI